MGRDRGRDEGKGKGKGKGSGRGRGRGMPASGGVATLLLTRLAAFKPP